MGYVIGKKRFFTTKATITLPDENGQVVDHVITGKFRIGTREELEAAGFGRPGAGDGDLLKVVLVDVPDLSVQDDDGTDRILGQEERVAAALNDPPARNALWNAYTNAISGRIARKN